jgi:hypothetical protein
MFFISTEVLADHDPQQIKEELLQTYNKQLKTIENITFDFEIRGYRGSENKPITLCSVDEGHCCFDNITKQVLKHINRTLINENGNNVLEKTQTIQILQSLDKYFLVIKDHVNNNIIFNSWLKKQFTELDILMVSGFAPTFGYVITVGNDGRSKLNSYADIIKVADIFTETDNDPDNRDNLIRIEAKIEKFQIKMWFSPSQKYMIKKIQKKSSGASGGAELLSSEEVVLESQLINDIYLPCRFQSHGYFSSGKVEVREGETVNTPATEDKLECILSNFRVNNKNDFIITDIPNGTNVFMQDAPQIEYVWFDGKTEPKTNELMLRIARGGHRFMPGVYEPRFWLITAGAVLIVLGLFFKIKMILQDWKEK